MSSTRDTLRAGIADIVDTLEPTIRQGLDTAPEAHLRLIEITAALREEADATLRASVDSARAAGVSWDGIGDALHITRQAAQQRFGTPRPHAGATTWRLTPLTSFDELQRLNEEGRRGWHSVGFGALYHDLERDDVQWEHRRVSVFERRAPLEQEGWQKIGSMWFPWAYYARPTGAPALTDAES